MPLFVPDSRAPGVEWRVAAMIEERREETARGRQELPETPHERANDRKDRRGEALHAPRSPRTTASCEFFNGLLTSGWSGPASNRAASCVPALCRTPDRPGDPSTLAPAWAARLRAQRH